MRYGISGMQKHLERGKEIAAAFPYSILLQRTKFSLLQSGLA